MYIWGSGADHIVTAPMGNGRDHIWICACRKNYLEEKLGKYFYVAEEDKRIIGFVYGTVHEAEYMAVFADGQPYIEVDDIYISQGSRNSGLGSTLLDKLLGTAKENGIERSLIYSSTKNMEGILQFYKKTRLQDMVYSDVQIVASPLK